MVNILASSFSKIFSNPSLSAVYLTCSEPGLIPNSALVERFFSTAWLAIDDALDKSSYDEFVQEPINPHSIFLGQSFFNRVSAIWLTGVAISGENGPLICGSSSERLISINSSKYFSGFW